MIGGLLFLQIRQRIMQLQLVQHKKYSQVCGPRHSILVMYDRQGHRLHLASYL